MHNDMFSCGSAVQPLVMSCNCLIKTPDAKYHKHGCPIRAGIKFPVLFYYEDAVDSFIPAPDRVDEILCEDLFSRNGEEIEIRFKRHDLTDQEMDDLPEG